MDDQSYKVPSLDALQSTTQEKSWNFAPISSLAASLHCKILPSRNVVSSAHAWAVLMTFYDGDDIDLFLLALDSIATQQCNIDLRIYLCVDGPLSSEKEASISKLSQTFYKIIRNPTNLGLARSLNTLIDLLEDEELVFRMDGDDISLPHRFSYQAAMMEKNPELALVGAQAVDIDHRGQELRERHYPIQHNDIVQAMMKLNPILHPSYCIRRDVFRNINIRYPNAYLTEDYAFLVQLLRYGHRFSNCEEVLIKWRVNNSFLKRRRSLKRGATEFLWYGYAIYLIKGIATTSYIYPIARFVIRLMPYSCLKLLYGSSVRSLFLRQHGTLRA